MTAPSEETSKRVEEPQIGQDKRTEYPKADKDGFIGWDEVARVSSPELDWACAECRPESHVLVPGFACQRHRSAWKDEELERLRARVAELEAKLG